MNAAPCPLQSAHHHTGDSKASSARKKHTRGRAQRPTHRAIFPARAALSVEITAFSDGSGPRPRWASPQQKLSAGQHRITSSARRIIGSAVQTVFSAANHGNSSGPAQHPPPARDLAAAWTSPWLFRGEGEPSLSGQHTYRVEGNKRPTKRLNYTSGNHLVERQIRTVKLRGFRQGQHRS